MNVTIHPIYGATNGNTVRVKVPGSKSITTRALLLAALADGTSRLVGAATEGDCASFVSALRSLGIEVFEAPGALVVCGCGGRLPASGGEVCVGSAGTAARFLTALAALSQGTFSFDSSDQMRRRPMGPLIRALSDMGAKFTFSGEPYCFPFTVTGTPSPKDEVQIDISESSQYLSALLMCAPVAGRPIRVTPVGAHGRDYVQMTIDMMWSFGVDVAREGESYIVRGGYSPKQYEIEPDVSAACYFYAANRLLGTNISVSGLMPRTMQGDHKFIRLIKDFNGGEADMSSFSDQALTLAAVAPWLVEPTYIRGISHIRRQECDRIAAIVHNINALGGRAEEREDGVVVYPVPLKAGVADSFGDHRVAMSFAVAGLRCGLTIAGAEACQKTFPQFFEVLKAASDELTR